MRKVPASLAVLLLALGLATPRAFAQTAPTITLTASVAQVVFGESVTLVGSVSPPDASTLVEIRDTAGAVVATVVPDPSGAFAATIAPDGTDAYAAFIPDAISQPVTVRVRATMTIRSSPARLFDTVSVRGKVAPARPGQRVEVSLTRGGRTIDRRLVAMDPSGSFQASFEVPLPGTYRTRASFAADDLLRATATSGAGSTPLPRLSEGDDGIFVELLESRLAELHYRLLGTKDGRYDARTADAVVAFHKVQRMPRAFAVSAATWRRLAQPRLPSARHGWRGFHFEVDQTLQVLYTVESGAITNILHVSTGAGGATRDGTFRVYRKLAGFSPNRLYYPSYFDGLRALHGWTEVPTYNASHGCVRIPYWNAKWVYGLADYGTRVAIYHS
jgi:hypothetical protein